MRSKEPLGSWLPGLILGPSENWGTNVKEQILVSDICGVTKNCGTSGEVLQLSSAMRPAIVLATVQVACAVSPIE